jgi:hypothetical protein
MQIFSSPFKEIKSIYRMGVLLINVFWFEMMVMVMMI